MGRKKKKEKPLTIEELSTLKRLEQRANKRISRMTVEMKEAIYPFRKGERFSTAKPANRGEFANRMLEVEKFLSSRLTTKRGWKELKKSAFARTMETLNTTRKYDFTDKEMANILREIGSRNKKQLYRALDIVQAKKYNTEAKGIIFDNEALEKAIAQALKSHMSYDEAIQFKTRAKKRKKKSAEELRK